MAKQTLVQIARGYVPHTPKNHEFSNEQIELFVGWAKGEYGLAAVSRALGYKRSNPMKPYHDIARGLRQAVSDGSYHLTPNLTRK